MLEYIFIGYGIWCFSVILHELGHLIIACIYKCKNIHLNIGEEFYSIKIKNISISPLILYAHVSFEETTQNKKMEILLYSMGIIVNIILTLFFLVLIKENIICVIGFIINLLIMICNALPIPVIENDGYKIYKLIKNR